MPNIYIYVADKLPRQDDGDLVCAALTDDGTLVAHHISSSADLARYDMGLTSGRKQDRYETHYPRGYSIVDLIDLSEDELAVHPQFSVAYARLHAALNAGDQ